MSLAPHPYLLQVRDHLRRAEPGRWAWFASDEWTAESIERARLELLRSTYRMEAASHARLYEIGARAAEALEIKVPPTFYQAQDDGGMNAGLLFVPDEAHIILRGRILATLAEEELAALIGHELAHHRLYTIESGTLRVADALLESIVLRGDASPSHVSTALRSRRYTELYCDRGSHLVTTDPAHIVACLVKVGTGLTTVDAAAYLRQAEEVLSKKKGPSEGVTHPETFVRARAIALWHAEGAAAEPAISAMVQGDRTLDALDLLDQVALTDATRVVIEQLLATPWFRSDAVLAHARSYFPDAKASSASGVFSAADHDKSVQEYFAYVLLDFAIVDEALGEAAMAHALAFAETLGIAEAFDRIARDELKLTKRAIEELRKKAPTTIAQAAAQHSVEA